MLPLEKHLDAPIPRVALGRFPTPAESHPELARQLGFGTLSIKREDKNALDGPGGNKLRALEWILPGAGSWIVSIGGYGSTYVAALSYYAQRRGQKVAVGLFPQPWVGSVPGTLAATESHARVFLAGAKWKLPFAVIRAWRHASHFGRPTWVPAGGANALGVLGGVNAALEFWEQVSAGEVAKPDVIVAPLGSGGTIAGLLIGSWIAGEDVTLCGVRVADPIVANRWQVNRLVASTRRLLRNSGLEVRPGSARVKVLTDFLGGGYGSPTPAARAAAKRVSGFNLALEQTYGAKSFAALDALRGSYHAPCFWNTFDPQIAIVPEETPLLRRARVTAECLWPHPTLI